MAAPRFINELSSAGSLSAGAAIAVFQSNNTFRTTPRAFITEAESYTQLGTGASSRTPQDKLREAFSISDFGAKGDDSADCQTAIVNCVTAAKLAGKAVYVPDGIFRHSDNFTLDGVVLYGNGDTSILKGTTSTDTAIILNGNGSAVMGVRLVGTSSATLSGADGAAIVAYQASEFRIQDISAETFRFPAIQVNGCTDGIISRNRLEDAFGGVFITNGAADTKRILVEHNQIRGMKDDSLAAVGGDASVTTQIEDVKFLHNILRDGSVARGVAMLGVKRGEIVGNTINDFTAAPGIIVGFDSTYSTEQCDDILIADNTLSTCGTAALSALLVVANGTEQSSNITLRDNRILASGRSGISVTGAGTPGVSFLKIIDNKIRSNGVGSGIEIDFTKDISVLGNTFDTIKTASMTFGSSCSGVLSLIGNNSRDDNTNNTGSVDWCTVASSSLTDIIAVGNTRTGTNALERGIENGTATATLRGGFNSFSNTGTDYTTTLGGLQESYEQGTFTPVLTFGGGSTGITYTARVGEYTRHGNRVEFNLSVVLSNKGSSSGVAVISGLPFTSKTIGTFGLHQLAVSFNALTFSGQVSARVDNNASSCSIWSFASGGALTQLDDSAFANSTNVFLAGHYEISSS